MSTNNSDFFSSIIKAKIRKYSKGPTISQDGKVISIGDGIAIVGGLDSVMLNELVLFENGTYGMALNLESDFVGVVILGKYEDIRENSPVKRTKNVVSVGVGEQLIGRIVDPLGRPVDGKGKISVERLEPIDKIAPGVMQRKSVDQPLETGILFIDSMFPIGKGQRELIIGDRQTGKSTIAIDTILNQKGKNVYCIYVAIGQKNSSIVQTALTLSSRGAMEYTTIVSSTASDIPAMKYISPFSGITIAEYFMNKGKDVLIVFDDLSKHAVSYRTISLLLRRPPGREAYPGDIFYLHSRLLERAGRLNEKNGGGSITALPIIETQAGDISAYIPTNVISITDGQLFMLSSMFNEGQRPAIGVGLSVSRVGSAAQVKSIKQTASTLKLELAQYEELSAFSKFGSELDDSTKIILDHGAKIMAILRQQQNSPISEELEVILLYIIKNRLIKTVPIEHMERFKNEIMFFMKNQKVIKELKNTKNIDENIDKQLLKIIKEFTTKFLITCKKLPKNHSITKKEEKIQSKEKAVPKEATKNEKK